ncbi:MAG: ABC transporter substrate-binding protein [Selenomonas sp.]|nr:ABC transporter substrate-binding protein [Selenomonas sp.]
MKGMMKKITAAALSLCLCAAAIGCGGSNTASKSSGSGSGGEQPKIILGQASWIGFAPLYIAQDKGFFKAHGADVEIQSVESKSDSRSALKAGKIQGVSTTADTQVVTAATGTKLKQIVALDTSSGGDGVIAKKEFTSIESLKGKKVAMDTTGGADFFWFQYMLEQKGMSLKDFDVQSMGAGDAGAAFVAGNVDAAVTWEPWLSKANKTDFGHTLVDSKATPGVIVDTLALSQETIDAHPEAAKAIVAGWYDALAFMKEHPDEAMEIMAKHLGEKPEAIKDEMKGVTFYDKEANKKYFGTKENPGEFYKIVKTASDLWLKINLIDKAVAPEDVIDGSFIDAE